MSKIGSRLFAAAKGEAHEKISILSGHDTVIAPVLAGLGVYSQEELCRWPPYASRIIFELWGIKHHSGFVSSTNSNEADVANTTFVRVLFNGVDVTTMIPTCPKDNLCTLLAFLQQIDSLLAPYNSLADACK